MPTIKKAIIKSYSAATHKATVQIAGSLGVWLSAIRVATNIPAADVVPGRQCTVLFLDPANQDDAVVIAVQGALPSTGELLQATATADLTLTQSAQSIVGDGNSTKVRLLLPTPGDWQVAATFDFHHTAAGAGHAIGELFVNDSGTPTAGEANLQEAAVLGSVVQRWKITTTVADTPIELKARKLNAAGTAKALATHTRLAASGVKRATGGGGTTDHAALTNLAYASAAHTGFASAADLTTHAAAADPHTVYGALAQAETWAALQTFNAGLQLAASQQIKDSGGTGRILPATASPHLTLTGDTKIASGNLAIRGTIDAEARININETVSADAFYGIRITPTVSNLTAGGGPLLASGTYTGASGTPIAIAGVQGVVAFRPAWVGGNYADGLNFRVTLAQYPSGTGTATADLLTGVTSSALVSVSGASKRIDVTDWWNIYAKQPQISLLSGGASTVATYIGVYVEGSTSASLSNITTAYGVRIGDSTTPGTVYLLEVGPTTPYLRVVGKAAPAANRTNLYLAEGVTPTLRQVAWEDSGAAGGAGLSANRKVLYLV